MGTKPSYSNRVLQIINSLRERSPGQCILPLDGAQAMESDVKTFIIQYSMEQHCSTSCTALAGYIFHVCNKHVCASCDKESEGNEVYEHSEYISSM